MTPVVPTPPPAPVEGRVCEHGSWPQTCPGLDAHPPRLAVDAHGYVWRVYPKGSLPGADEEMWSMCPVNPDNSPTPQPVTFYEPGAAT